MARSRGEEVCIDRRVQDCCLTIIVPRDSTGNVLRVGQIRVDAMRRIAIPAREPGHHVTRQGTRESAEALGPEVGVELIPRIPHRRMAVAEVHRAAGLDHGFGSAVTRRHDQVGAIEIELLDHGREQRQVLPISPDRLGQPLDQRRVNRTRLDQGGNGFRVVDQRVERRIREQPAHRLEHLLVFGERLDRGVVERS